MHIHKHDVSLDSEDIVDDFSQLATEKIAILTLSSPDLTLVKRRQFYELLLWIKVWNVWYVCIIGITGI